MKIEKELYAVVAPDGEIMNCWTSPNRLYDTSAAATRVRNQFVREAEDLLKNGQRFDTAKDIKRMAKVRQEGLERAKLFQVKKVIITIK